MNVSLHAFKDGLAVLCTDDAQRRSVWDRGALPIAAFQSIEEAKPTLHQFIAAGDEGRQYLKAALDKPQLELDDLMAVRKEIERFRA